MHIELTKETIKIVPDTVQDEAFMGKNLRIIAGIPNKVVIFEVKDYADTFYLESETKE